MEAHYCKAALAYCPYSLYTLSADFNIYVLTVVLTEYSRANNAPSNVSSLFHNMPLEPEVTAVMLCLFTLVY